MIGWIVASLSCSGWRFMWTSPRRAMTHVSWNTPRGGWTLARGLSRRAPASLKGVVAMVLIGVPSARQ
jgi:hypothetical protein